MAEAQAASARKYIKLAEKALDKKNGTEVIVQCRRALKIQPNNARALFLTGKVYQIAGEVKKAQQFLQQAINADPSNIVAYILLCETLISQGRMQDAIQICQRGTQVAPLDPRIHCTMTNLLIQSKNAHLVPGYVEKIRPALKEDDPELLQIWALALKINGRTEEADRVYEDVCKRFRVPASMQVMYETHLPRLMTDQEEIDTRRRSFEQSLDRFIQEKPLIDVTTLSMHPLFLLAYHNRDNKTLMTKFTQMLRACVPELNYVAPHCKKPPRTDRDKIHIGFTSRYMHDHPVGRCFRNWVTYLHQHGGFKVTLFMLENIVDSKIQALMDMGVEVVPLPSNIKMIQKKIATYELDIMIFPDIGMDPSTHYVAMARLAHYQCCLLGHPDTTGIDTVDYYISSRHYETEGAQKNYTETLLLLDSLTTLFTRPAPLNHVLTRKELGLPEDRKLYTCPMSVQKLHPDMDDVFKGILDADENATLILFADHQLKSASYQLRDRILKKCPADRVIFLAWQPMDKLWSILKTSDAVLTTIYFGAGTTSQYAFAYGIPLVTMPDDYVRSRFVAAYYNAMGITDAPIAQTLEDYVRLAVKLANDVAYKERLSQELLEKNRAIFEESGHGGEISKLMQAIIAQELGAYRA